MKKLIQTMIICAAMMISAVSVGASSYESCEIAIPIEVTRSGTVSISADNPSYPVPSATTIDVTGKSAFKMEYDEPETFTYKIWQEAGTEDGVTYDNTVYETEVIIESDDKGTLIPHVIMYKEGTTYKSDCAKFVNTYPEKTVTPAGASSGGTPVGGAAVGGSADTGAKPAPQTGDSFNFAVLAGTGIGIIGLFFIGILFMKKRKA